MSNAPDPHLRDLETQLRWLKQAFTVGAFVAASAVGIVGAIAVSARPGPPPPLPRSLDLDSLTIRDGAGRARIRMTANDAEARIGFLDELGIERMGLLANKNSRAVILDKQLSLMSASAYAGFAINDWQGDQPRERVLLGVMEDRSPKFFLRGKKATGINLFLDETDQQFIQLRDENDKPRAGLGLLKNLGAGFFLVDANGKALPIR